MYEITIITDSNDADYNTLIDDITPENLERIRPLIAAIKKFQPYTVKYKSAARRGAESEWTHDNNWPVGEYGCREDLGEKSPEEIYKGVVDDDTFEFFSNMIPMDGQGNVHTINSITVCPLQKKEVLL